MSDEEDDDGTWREAEETWEEAEEPWGIVDADDTESSPPSGDGSGGPAHDEASTDPSPGRASDGGEAAEPQAWTEQTQAPASPGSSLGPGRGQPTPDDGWPSLPLILSGSIVALVVLVGLLWVILSGSGGPGISVAEPTGVSTYQADTGAEVPVATGELLVYLEPNSTTTREDVEAAVEPLDFEVVGHVDPMSMYQVRGNHSRLDEVRSALEEEPGVRDVVPNMALTFQGHEGWLDVRHTTWEDVIRVPNPSTLPACEDSVVGVVDTEHGGHGPHVAAVVREVAPTVSVEERWLSTLGVYRVGVQSLVDAEGARQTFASMINAEVATFLRDHRGETATIQLTAGPGLPEGRAGAGVAPDKVRAVYEEFLRYLHPTIEFAEGADALVVLSAGNNGVEGTAISSPTWVDQAMFVGAIEHHPDAADPDKTLDQNVYLGGTENGKAAWTNWGPNVAIYSSGEKVGVHQYDGAEMKAMNGTSVASPQVSAAAALVRCIAPDLDSTETKNLLVRTATKAVTGYSQDIRVLNVQAAVEEARAVAEGRIARIEQDLHHLGDDSYAGSENSQLELASEGSEITLTFDVDDEQLDHGTATLSIRNRGTEEQNPVTINGRDVGSDLCCSPDDGGFWVQEWTLDTSLLREGSNALRIESAENSANPSDIDDFEFSDVTIRFEP